MGYGCDCEDNDKDDVPYEAGSVVVEFELLPHGIIAGHGLEEVSGPRRCEVNSVGPGNQEKLVFCGKRA